MTLQSLIKKIFWITLWSWMFSGGAEAHCVHESAPGSGNGLFELPTLGDLFVFGLAVLVLWGISVWLMDKVIPQSQRNSLANASRSHYAVQNRELTGLQSKTETALRQMQDEYEQRILERMHQDTREQKLPAGTPDCRSQQAASV